MTLIGRLNRLNFWSSIWLGACVQQGCKLSFLRTRAHLGSRVTSQITPVMETNAYCDTKKKSGVKT